MTLTFIVVGGGDAVVVDAGPPLLDRAGLPEVEGAPRPGGEVEGLLLPPAEDVLDIVRRGCLGGRAVDVGVPGPGLSLRIQCHDHHRDPMSPHSLPEQN